MRYGSRPSSLLEWFAFKAGKVPLPILDTLLAPLQARALMVAGRCGVLARLADRPDTTAEVARSLGLDEECLELVLRVLESMAYVTRRGDRWMFTKTGRRYFGPRAPERYDAFVEYGPPQWAFIERLEEVLRTGKGIDFHAHQTSEEWRDYQRSMLEGARGFARFIVARTPIQKNATSCLDLAGSHGYVGGLLAQAHPPMTSIVLDRPEALATARDLGADQPWHSLVTFREGDLLRDDFGRTQHDVVVLSNILHHFPDSTNIGILERVHAALKEHGTVSIFEIEAPEKGARADAAGNGLALYFRITSTSACFRASDYLEWLARAGFKAGRVVRSVTLPGRMLVVARK